MQPDIKSIIFILIWGVIVHFFAIRSGFFRKPDIKKESLSGKAAIGGFLIYFLISILIAPLAIIAYKWIKEDKKESSLLLSTQELGWFQFGMILFLFFAFILFLKSLSQENRKLLWGGDSIWTPKHVKSFFVGVIAVFISYPAVIFTSSLMEWLIQWIWGKNALEQAAVEQLKGLLAYKPLFVLSAISIVFIVPFIEELLFRGLLQTWLRRYLGWVGSLVLTALIFAFFHFATSQGVKNLEVILALFVLSLYLGWVYEREGTLVASIGLHMTFNAFNVIAILYQ